MNSLSLPVVHPGFQKLKRNGRLLHFAAAGLILAHAVSHFKQPHANPLYLGCLLIIALDIFILLFAARNALTDLPRINLFFRLVEVVFFFGIGITMLTQQQWFMGPVHLLLGVVYIYLFSCEKNIHFDEQVAIHHSGISIPALPDGKFYNWTHINCIEARYDSITIITYNERSYHFDLQKNLEFEELDQIHEFCRHYLGAGQ